MKKIALDFDSVLSDTMITWVEKYNEKHKKDYTKDHIREWSFWEQNEFNFSMNDAFEFFREAWKDWECLPPTESNLKEKVSKLIEFGQVDIVTSVEKEYLKNVNKWMEKYNLPKMDVVSSHKLNKVKDFDYDLYIDDDPLLANDAHVTNKKILVYGQKWNRDLPSSPYITRIDTLNDAINHISKMRL